MSQIKTFVLEDDIHFLPLLLKQLNNQQNVSLVGYSTKLDEAIEKINLLKPELLILDIKIGNQTSFKLLNQITEFPFQIIFISSYEEYAIKAIKRRAIDYLLKPFDELELRHAIEIVINNKSAVSNHIALNDIDNNLKRITLKTMEEMYFVDPLDVIFCQGDGNYTTFNFIDGSKVVVSHSIKFYENLLADFNFYRVHKSFLVQLNQIKKFNKSTHSIVLNNGKLIEVSRRRKENLIHLLR